MRQLVGLHYWIIIIVTIEEFLQILNMEITVNIILFLAGLAIGNWLAVGRDKRKEFNQIADKVYLKLKKQKESVKKNSAVVSSLARQSYIYQDFPLVNIHYK